MKNTEVWKPVLGLEKFYEISSCGRLKSLRNSRRAKAGHIMSKRLHNGRIYYTVTINKKQLPILAHRLVTETFISKCPKGKQVHHKNENPTDNKLSNLEYVTPSYNSRYSNCGSRNKRAKLKEKDIPKIRNLLKLGVTQTRISHMFGVSQHTIWVIKENKNWTHI